MASLFALPNNLIIQSLITRFPGRDAQIWGLVSLVSIRAVECPSIVVYGLEATGKSLVTKAVLEELSKPPLPDNGSQYPDNPGNQHDQLRYVFIKSAECISGRHLLEQTVGAVAKAVGWEGNIGRCETLAQLLVEIQKMLNAWTLSIQDNGGRNRLVLVFDGIDSQRDTQPTLVSALTRFCETVPNLTIIYIVRSFSLFYSLPIPHVPFPSYSKPEAVQILSLTQPKPQLPEGPEATTFVWTRFLPVVYETISKHSGRDIVSFREDCFRLWPAFIQPLLNGTHSATPFTKLLTANKHLFQNDSASIRNIITKPLPISVLPNSSQRASQRDPTTIKPPSPPQPQGITTQLPYHTRLLLVSAYLASYNPAKTDPLHFLKSASSRRRKKGGGTALTPSKNPKNRKIARKLLGPQPFSLERMFAIFHAIRKDADSSSVGKYRPFVRKGEKRGGKRGRVFEEVSGAADVQMAVSTLASLRLVVKMGAVNGGDGLDGGAKYKVAVGWDVARSVARSVGVEAEDYLAE